MMTGPFETEAEVRALPAVRAVYDAFRAGPGVRKMAPHNARMITDACDDAGVTLGAYDRRIVEWLAGFEPETCAVITGLISRAAEPRPVAQPILCAHADQDGRGMHWLAPGEKCDAAR